MSGHDIVEDAYILEVEFDRTNLMDFCGLPAPGIMRDGGLRLYHVHKGGNGLSEHTTVCCLYHRGSQRSRNQAGGPAKLAWFGSCESGRV